MAEVRGLRRRNHQPDVPLQEYADQGEHCSLPHEPSEGGDLTLMEDSWSQIMEYLGFKLESTRGPIESIVIDRLERPTKH